MLVRDVNAAGVRLRLTGHRKLVSCIAYSPDGKTLATAGDEASIRLWDAATGRLLHCLDGHKPVAQYWNLGPAVAFSPDGKQLVSGSVDKTVRLWNVATGKEVRRLGEHEGEVLCVSFTPDGKHVLTGGWDEPIQLWDAATGKVTRRFPERSEGARRVAFAPGGKTMAVVHGACHAPRFWDVASGREILISRGPESAVTGIVFSRDGRMLTTARYDGIWQWETETGREVRSWENVLHYPSSLASSPDGQIVAGGDDTGTICLWQADTGRQLRRIKGPKGWVLALAFAPDGKTLASSSYNDIVSLWDVATGAELHRLTGHKSYAPDVTFAPDGKTLASVAVDQSVRLWRVDSGEEQRRLKTRHSQPRAVAISPDGSLLVAASPDKHPVQVWELATGRELPSFAPLPDAMLMYSAMFSPDGRMLATGGEDGVVRLWEVGSGQERRRLAGHTGHASRLRFSPDGTRLASASNDTTAVVWDLTTPSADERKLAAGLTAEQAEALWADLAGDAERADRAIRVLAAAPARAVPLLGRRLTPAPKVDPGRVKKLIAQLDDDRFAERDRAAKELAALDELALPALRAAAEATTSLEHRRLVDKLLKRPSLVSSPEVLRSLRAIEALERVGTPEAQRVLASLTRGAPEARLTREAKAAVERLGKRLTEKP